MQEVALIFETAEAIRANFFVVPPTDLAEWTSIAHDRSASALALVIGNIPPPLNVVGSLSSAGAIIGNQCASGRVQHYFAFAFVSIHSCIS